MEASQITRVVGELAQQLPSLITLLVCMVVVITRWKRHPKVSLLALIGLSLLFLHGPIFILIYSGTSSLLIKSTYTSEDIRNVFLGLGLIYHFTRAIAFVPLLAAIFIRRPLPA